jgi:hypothetical protein
MEILNYITSITEEDNEATPSVYALQRSIQMIDGKIVLKLFNLNPPPFSSSSRYRIYNIILCDDLDVPSVFY